MSIANKIDYRHYFDPVPLDFNWEDKFKYKLIESEQELKDLLGDCTGRVMAYDCETDGLDYRRNEMIGFSFSFDAWSGYYIPIRHVLSWDEEGKEEKRYEDTGLIHFKKPTQDKILKKLIKANESIEGFSPDDDSVIDYPNIFLESLMEAKSLDKDYLEIIKEKIEEATCIYPLDLEEHFPESLKILKENFYTLEPSMKKIKIKKYKESEKNLNPKNCLDIIYDALRKSKLTLCHNATFDMSMLKKEGYDTSKINIFDTMVLTYNSDTNAKGMMGLKPATEHFLGRRATKFKEVLGTNKTLKDVDPSACAFYASCDTGNTFGLFQVLYPTLKREGCEKILSLDNKLVKAFADYYVENPLYIDKLVMNEYKDTILKRIEELEMSIFQTVGYPFNIRSRTKELPAALMSLGIDTGVRTETGCMSTAKDALLQVSGQHPIVKELIELSSLEKQLNSYIDKLSKCDSLPDNPNIGICRINYKLFDTASGRLASGTGGKSKAEDNDYFINLNIQNLTKPKPAIYEAIKLDNDYQGILGYEFKLIGKPDDVKEYVSQNPNKYFVEGLSPDLNVRKAIRVKNDDELILSVDYSAQELKLAGVISGEPNFVEPFKEGRDVHTEMAKKLFGEENYDKEKRKAAKVANFGLLYGGSPPVLKAVAEQMGVMMSEEESQELYNKWWNANITLKVWKDLELNKAEKETNFTVTDMFGRPRRVKHYLTSDDRGTYNFGVRTIASHKIQGSGSSIMRQLLVNLANKIFLNPKYSSEVAYVSSVHDECNYRINKRRFTQWAKVIEDLMVFNPPNFPIPIDCSIEVGDSLGHLFAFKWEDDSRVRLIPKRCN